MGNNVKIIVGGKNRYFSNVNKLGIGLQDGGESLWVDKSNTEANQIVGKDADGNDYIVTTDIGGNIVKTMLPTEIRVVTRPNKTSYVDGETIDYAGMVVKAYDANGNVWSDSRHPNGIIPINELTLITSKIEVDYETAIWGTDGEVYVGSTLASNNLWYGIRNNNYDDALDVTIPVYGIICNEWTSVASVVGYFDIIFYYDIIPFYVALIRRAWYGEMTLGYIIAFREKPSLQAVVVTRDGGPGSRGYSSLDTSSSASDRINTYTYDNKTVYYLYKSMQYTTEEHPEGFTSYIQPRTNFVNQGAMAWAMVYEEWPAQQFVPISWNRPGDGKELRTSIALSVFEA